MAERSKATDRLMSVFMVIAEFGPISLADLTRMTFLPRSSAHRAAQALQRKGWVRARMSDHTYEVTNQFTASLTSSTAGVLSLDLFDPILRDLANSTNLVFEIGAFTELGKFDSIDTTEHNMDVDTYQSLLIAPGALMAQLALPPELLIRHLDAFFRYATEAEKFNITSGAHNANLIKIRTKGHAAIKPYLGFPYTMGKDEFGSILVKPPFRSSVKSIEDDTLVDDILTELRRSSTEIFDLRSGR